MLRAFIGPLPRHESIFELRHETENSREMSFATSLVDLPAFFFFFFFFAAFLRARSPPGSSETLRPSRASTRSRRLQRNALHTTLARPGSPRYSLWPSSSPSLQGLPSRRLSTARGARPRFHCGTHSIFVVFFAMPSLLALSEPCSAQRPADRPSPQTRKYWHGLPAANDDKRRRTLFATSKVVRIYRRVLL